MTSLNQIKCDLCNNLLKDNEMDTKQGLINFGNPKPKSKYNLQFTYESQIRKGDLCMSCARKVRDYIEDLKEGKFR